MTENDPDRRSYHARKRAEGANEGIIVSCHLALSMGCKHTSLLAAGLLAIAGHAALVRSASAETAAADPVAALRALHADTAATRLTAIYDMGTRRLRRMLMGRGLCTVPIRQRMIVCQDTIGLLSADAEIGPATDGAVTGTRIVSVKRVSATPRDLRYVFTRGPAGWQIDGIEAPGAAEWALAPLATETPAAVARASPPAIIQQPQALAVSTPMRRADRQRRLTRQN